MNNSLAFNSKPHILFHRSNPWHSSIQCSTKTYAKYFQQGGYAVSYLQDNIHLGHWLLRRGYYHTWKKGCYWDKGIWVCASLAMMPKLDLLGLSNRTFNELHYKSCIPSIRHQLVLSGLPEPAIIWSVIPGSHVLKKIFHRSKLVMNVVDYYPAFHGDAIKQIERQDYESADHILVTGNTLKNYLIEELDIQEKKITILGQGVLIDQYKQQYTRPSDMPICEGPIAIWVGVLQKADIELMERLAVEISQLNGCIVLIGPPGDWDVTALQQRCVVRLGTRSSQEVPAYLSHAEIGLMLYDRSRASVYRGQNPLKLYEYLAAGLSVLSTPHDEYDYMDPPVIIVRNPDDIPGAITISIEKKDELSIRGKDFAAIHTWKNCFDLASQAILRLLDMSESLSS